VERFLEFPLLVLGVSLFVLWLSAQAGVLLRLRFWELAKDVREDYSIIIAAALTLLGLLIGFTFSMATSRYDLRKHCEAEEANAIGTEYLRAGILSPADAAKVRALLKDYIDQRIRFYSAYHGRDGEEISHTLARTAELQNEMWSAVAIAAGSRSDAPMALVLSGMNDVLDTQGYAQAAFWNRIPAEAWVLMGLIAIVCNILLGYGAHGHRSFLLVVLPLTLAIAFALLADIESPERGAIRIHPRNLEGVAKSIHQQ
jgi:hypothetical protein